jgi:hypothetical protein
MKKNYFIAFAFLFTLVSFSQEKVTNEKYQKYFENTREIPFLHLNKTRFIQGEEIWFKAYIQEQNSQKLHPTTTNLYISIFDEKSKLKDQKLIHIKNGLGYGSILLDSTYNGKNYYIKASTKWMKNFQEDNAFYQKISIISSIENEKSITVSEKDFFEFKLFPEGGHYVANTLNNIGILIKDNKNRGVKIQKGVIKDQKNNIIRQFKTNEFGMNSVRLFIKNNQSYTFHATLSNGTQIKASTPFPESKGISLIVNNKNQLTINVITNKETLQEIAGKQYRILVHNTRNYRNFPFTFKESNFNHALILKEEELNPGINIITLFNDENKPISERLVYKKSDDLFQNIRISNTKRMRNDSVAVKFTNPSKEQIFLSASFLPGNTEAYQPKNNIISSYLLKPYVKGLIQNPVKLLGATYEGQRRDLDLLLLIQGWSKYKWNNIFHNPPKTNFKFENGIDLTARINKTLSSKQSIVVSSNENKLIRIITHKENPWVLKNSFLKKNSTLNFGLSSNDNYFKITPALSYSGGKLTEFINDSQIELTKKIELEVNNFKPLKNEYENLNEVEVDANKRRRKTRNHERVYGGMTMLTARKMENRIIASGETVIDYLIQNRYGYNRGAQEIIPRGTLDGTDIVRPVESSDDDSSNTSTSSAPDRFGRPLVRVYLDGDEISNAVWILESVYLNTVDEIFFGRDPGRIGEVIHIFRLNPAEYIDKRAEFAHVKIPIGFATEKEYYNPIYPSYVNDTYQKYGCMFWKPNINLQGYLSETILIPANLQEKAQVYIEGITETGKLISKRVVLNIKK